MNREAKNMPRKPCANCARKHLGQAVVLLQESIQGYPSHRWLAVGHIAEAEAEIGAMFPDIMEVLRRSRKDMEKSEEYLPDLMPVVVEISSRLKKKSRSSCEGSCSLSQSPLRRSGKSATRRGRL